MSKEKRYLITGADERTWKFDRPVVFLGEWCKTFDRKHVWQAMDAITAEPYGLELIQKDFDFTEARKLEDMLFPILCNALNHQHGVQHNELFWRIVLGHWFRRIVDVMLNRVKTLEQCLNAYQISGATFYAKDDYALTTPDSYSAIWAFNDDRWNIELNARILTLLGLVRFPLETIKGVKSTGFYFNALGTTRTFKKTVLKIAHKQLGKCLSWFVRDNDAFIINSYLPKKEEIKLQLTLKQCPQLWTSPKLQVLEKPDGVLRENLTNKIASKSYSNNLHKILSLMLFELLPTCYLEGFKNLDELAKRQPWPKFPKFIFTSNNFDTDEVFKLWSANKIESGSKYFIGQHGNNSGTYRYLYHSIEEVTADKYLTWGWTDGLSQHTPAFVFKTVGRKAECYNPQGGLLLIEDMFYQRLDTWDRCAEHDNYFTDQVKFTQILLEDPFAKLIVRLHSSFKYNNPYENKIWHEINPAIKIDTGDGAIRYLIANSRLVVHSYDSTGILETLSQNIPTLAFWRNGFDHLRDSAKPFYQLLVDAGIVHFSAESVASKVNEVWDNVDTWWWQSKVQDARLNFCERYARIIPNPLAELKLQLTNHQ